MRITLLSVGKTDDPLFEQIIASYRKKIGYFIPFEMTYVPDIKRRSLPEKEQAIREGEQLLKLLQPSDYVVLLDENGRQYTSADFADYLQKKMNMVSKRLVFIIGGPYGFSSGVYDAADEQISLSKMTFTHQMVRLLFTEQLYRAMTILKGKPYHHDGSNNPTGRG